MISIISKVFLAAVFAMSALMLPAVADELLAGKQIHFVVGSKVEDPSNDDFLIKRHLESQGAVVNLAVATDAAKRSRNADLIVISSTADAS